MALSGNTVWEIETGGSDTNNGGAFDPGQTAGMLTDGAATVANTSAPVFTSASYNFIAGDVGAWIYISSGTNWTAGWYKIVSVAANAATLNATIGQGVLKTLFSPSTVVGCATVASPTAATWSIDYSQQSSAQFAYTDLASVGSGLLVSSVAKPFGKQQVGNSIVITGGTNFNTGRYVIASVSVGLVATVVGPTNITSAAGVSGTGGQGGAVASVGIVGGVIVSSNFAFIKSGSYSVTSASTNIAAGCFSSAATAIMIQGYGSIRGDFGTMPVITASGISTFTILNLTNNDSVVANMTIDSASLTASISLSIARGIAYKVNVKNCTNGGIAGAGVNNILCQATGCTTVSPFNGLFSYACEASGNTVTAFASTRAVECLAYNNTGASTDGFAVNATGVMYSNCVAYGNGRSGFRGAAGNSGYAITCINCIAEANVGAGYDKGNNTHLDMVNCATYNNGSPNTIGSGINANPITGLSSFFVSVAGTNFALNNTAGAGALARAAGIPGTFPSGTTIGYLDVGTAQHKDPVGGGSGFFYS